MYLDYSNTNIPQPHKFSIERRSALSEKKPSIPRNQGLKCLALAMFILIFKCRDECFNVRQEPLPILILKRAHSG